TSDPEFMTITVQVKRYIPETEETRWDEWQGQALPTWRILDALHAIKWELDGILSFRRSCAHGVCGSDAMRINGRNMLACITLVRDVGANITVEPILGLKVAKDLIVDMNPFFDNYKKILPYSINDNSLPADGKERLQS